MQSPKNNKKTKRSKDGPIPKPKRPMSACECNCCLMFLQQRSQTTICFFTNVTTHALTMSCHIDNFFFRDQRNEILHSPEEDSENKKSFADIGKLIGQRWREIKPDEVSSGTNQCLVCHIIHLFSKSIPMFIPINPHIYIYISLS